MYRGSPSIADRMRVLDFAASLRKADDMDSGKSGQMVPTPMPTTPPASPMSSPPLMALRSQVEETRNFCEIIRLKDAGMVNHLPGMGMPPEMGGGGMPPGMGGGGLQNMPGPGPAGMPPGGMPMPGPMMGGM